jgi:hypothetical protein
VPCHPPARPFCLPLSCSVSLSASGPKKNKVSPRAYYVQRQKPDAVAAFNTNLASMMRILVNVTFLFDAAKYPQHAR